MKRIRSTNDRLVDVIVFDPKKNIKLQPVTPLMPLEALLIPVNFADSDSDGINGGTGCNFIFFYLNFSLSEQFVRSQLVRIIEVALISNENFERLVPIIGIRPRASGQVALGGIKYINYYFDRKIS